MNIYNVNIPIYAETENEVQELRQVIVWFINLHRDHNRVVSAKKVSDAIKAWDSNFLVKRKIIEHFK